MVVTLGVMTLAWWGLAVVAPAMLATRALRRGREALERRAFGSAEQLLRRAAREPALRAQALPLLAESALRAGRPDDALFVLEESADLPADEARRARLLRGVACSWLGRGAAAQRTLEPLAESSEATPEELLAMAQACLVAGDADAAGVFLAMIRPDALAGPLAARLGLCAAAIAWRHGRRAEALAHLPEPAACVTGDALLIKRLRAALAAPRARPNGKLAAGEAAGRRAESRPTGGARAAGRNPSEMI